MQLDHYVFDNNEPDIAPDVLDEKGNFKILPASFWQQTTTAQRAVFGNKHAVYSFPTDELVEHLRSLIDGRSAIEIGSGNGVLAEALGIRATDNKQQDLPWIKAYYQVLGQPTIRYGANVEHLDAHAAIEKYKPEVVIGCWVTERFDPSRPEKGGNAEGVNEEWVLEHCDSYINVGNDKVHGGKSIWAEPHSVLRPDWLYSRAANGTPNYVAHWSR